MTLDQQIDARFKELCQNSPDSYSRFIVWNWLIAGGVWMRRDYPNFGLSEDFCWHPKGDVVYPVQISEVTGFTT